MFRRIHVLSLASIALAVCVASIGALTPSAMAMDMAVDDPYSEGINIAELKYEIQLPSMDLAHYAIVPRTVDRTYLEKPRALRFNYKAETRNIAITHFVKGGGVTYTHGSKAVAFS